VLEPDARQLLLDSLRPPSGFALDRAVGTTFSLDLHALLITPLAFALFDTGADDGRPDPVALLEAVRRNAARIDLFCQAGQIALPSEFERVLAYVEESVHMVVPDAPGRVFHPKVWAIRFVGEDGEPRYRMLCLTRNLTFARSWDTILALEGLVGRRSERNGRPLADFVRALPDLGPVRVPSPRRQGILDFADELASVAFAPPTPFDDVALVPLGIKRYRRRSLPLEGDELRLVVSPFLSAGLATDFSGPAPVMLVSRAESLDALPKDALPRFEPFVISSDASGPVEDDTEIASAPNEIVAERAGCTLRGLHAKLYLAERGWDARIWTGSANATAAAFSGNVEFLVELRGRRARCGLDALLGDDSALTFENLLEPYTPPETPPAGKSEQELLEEKLDALRHSLAVARFVAGVEARGSDEEFVLTLSAQGGVDLPSGLEGTVRPISLTEARSRPLAEALHGQADFGVVSFDRLTSFYAIELVLSEGRHKAAVRFVVNAELQGAPENRSDRLLTRLLESRENVLRYLLLLLADDGFAADGSGPITRLLEALDHAGAWEREATVPLLESLIRALARDPARLDHVARLVESLSATPEGESLLPEGFEDVWRPIWDAKGAAS
jgi:hypothetical protein